MSKVGYSISTEGAVALTGGAAKSILGAAAQAAAGLQLDNYEIAFDGVSASGVPVLVELCYATFATNAPGTNSTSVTVDQMFGRALAAGLTAAKSWTAEPTVLTPFREYLLTPNAGLIAYQYPLGQEPDAAFSQGFVIRLNAPANVNVRASMGVSRI